jgi:hypothetical protein
MKSAKPRGRPSGPARRRWIGPVELDVPMPPPRQRGRPPKGHRKPERVAELLAIYDQTARVDPKAAAKGSLPRLLAGCLHRSKPGYYAASESTLIKHLQRLLGERARRLTLE